jgi:hypothetical protein
MIGPDVLKILYASEDEKVTIGETGKLTIISAGGEVTTCSEVETTQEVMEAKPEETKHEEPEPELL